MSSPQQHIAIMTTKAYLRQNNGSNGRERERCQATEERDRPLQWKRDWGGTKRAWGHKKWNILITKTKAYLLWQNKSFNSFVSLCWCSICTVLPRPYRVVTSPFYRGLNLLLTGSESVKKKLPVITSNYPVNNNLALLHWCVPCIFGIGFQFRQESYN